MSRLPNGEYRTDAGSTLRVSGKYSGIFEVEFDWFEEMACCDCHASAHPEQYDDEWFLVWHCEICDGGQAKILLDAELCEPSQ